MFTDLDMFEQLSIADVLHVAGSLETGLRLPHSKEALTQLFCPGARAHFSRRLLSGLPYDMARLGEFSYPPGTLIKYLNEVQPVEAWPKNCITHDKVLEDVDAAELNVCFMLTLGEAWDVEAEPAVAWIWERKPEYAGYADKDCGFNFLSGDLFIDMNAVATPCHAAAYFQCVIGFVVRLYRTFPKGCGLMLSCMHNLMLQIAVLVDRMCGPDSEEDVLDSCTKCFRCYAMLLSFQQLQLLPFLDTHPTSLEAMRGEHEWDMYVEKLDDQPFPLCSQLITLHKSMSDPFPLPSLNEIYRPGNLRNDLKVHTKVLMSERRPLKRVPCAWLKPKPPPVSFCLQPYALLSGDAEEDATFFETVKHAIVYISATLKYMVDTYRTHTRTRMKYQELHFKAPGLELVALATEAERIISERPHSSETCQALYELALRFQENYLIPYAASANKLSAAYNKDKRLVRDLVASLVGSVSMVPHLMRLPNKLNNKPTFGLPSLSLQMPPISFAALAMTLSSKRNMDESVYRRDEACKHTDPHYEPLMCTVANALYKLYCEVRKIDDSAAPLNVNGCYDALERLFSLQGPENTMVLWVTNLRGKRKFPKRHLTGKRIKLDPEGSKPVHQRSVTLHNMPRHPPFYKGDEPTDKQVMEIVLRPPEGNHEQMKHLFPFMPQDTVSDTYDEMIRRNNLLTYDPCWLYGVNDIKHMNDISLVPLCELYIKAFLPCSSDSVILNPPKGTHVDGFGCYAYRCREMRKANVRRQAPKDIDFLYALLPLPPIPEFAVLHGSAHLDYPIYCSYHHAAKYLLQTLTRDGVLFVESQCCYLTELSALYQSVLSLTSDARLKRPMKISIHRAKSLYDEVLLLSQLRPEPVPLMANMVKLCPRVYLHNERTREDGIMYTPPSFVTEALNLHFEEYRKQCEDVTEVDFYTLHTLLKLCGHATWEPPEHFNALKAYLSMCHYLGNVQQRLFLYPPEDVPHVKHDDALKCQATEVRHLESHCRSTSIIKDDDLKVEYRPAPVEYNITKMIA